MATEAFEEIVEDFEFLEDWEDRYRYVIEQGKAMAPLDDVLKVPATKVDGCASQVWLHPSIQDGVFSFDGDSDAMIVRGLIALLQKLYNGLAVKDVLSVDARADKEKKKPKKKKKIKAKSKKKYQKNKKSKEKKNQ